MVFFGNGMVLENCINLIVISWCIVIRIGFLEIIVLDYNWSKKNCVFNVFVLFVILLFLNFFVCIINYVILVFLYGMIFLKRLEFIDIKGNFLVLKDLWFGCIFFFGKFVVLDFDNDFVFIFDENVWLFCKEFCFFGLIVIDKDDLIYIVDFYEYCIIVINFEGFFRNIINLLFYVFYLRSIFISFDYKFVVVFRNSVVLF